MIYVRNEKVSSTERLNLKIIILKVIIYRKKDLAGWHKPQRENQRWGCEVGSFLWRRDNKKTSVEAEWQKVTSNRWGLRGNCGPDLRVYMTW